VPLPFPLAPEVIVIQEGTLLTDQGQPLGAVTFTLPLPPPAPNEALVGLTE
jgi:hypothetical protein